MHIKKRPIKGKMVSNQSDTANYVDKNYDRPFEATAH